MKISQRQLRTLIEAEVDKMRLPKGPNSRDDAEDRPLEELDESHLLREEVDPIYDNLLSMMLELSFGLDEIWRLSDPDNNPEIRESILKTFKVADKITARLRKSKSQAQPPQQEKGYWVGSRWKPE